MWLTFEEYAALGGSTVPDDVFAWYELEAEQTVKMHVGDPSPLGNTQKNGLARLVDVFYQKATGTLPNGPVAGFSNSKYSESYATPEAETVDNLVGGIIDKFFRAGNGRVLMTDAEWRREHERRR